ncbi:MAG: TetR/AcrR family transcriptional regulator [Pseudobacteriovorax sp.]|nr:TetR/AcrR family transcriptional regulator [Pseudobacteriovorax sp.]
MTHSEKKKRILKGAFDVFAKEGFQAVSMRKLSQELGVTTGTLYHYYRSKDELFTDIIKNQAGADIAQASVMVSGILERQERLELLVGFVDERSEYFSNLVLIIMDFVRKDESSMSPAEKKIKVAIYQAIEDYSKAIQVVLDLNSYECARGIFSYFVGSLLNRLVGAPRTSIRDLIDLITNYEKGETT